MVMDLQKIKLIQNASLEELKNNIFLEDLIIKLGFNTEFLREQPNIVKENGGGLLIWQYPNQFSKYLTLLQKQTISSYIEIGCRWGGTFVLTTEYLKRFNTITKSTAVDIINSPVSEYCNIYNETTAFMKMDSQGQPFKNYIENNTFDLIFIDGDHSYEGVKNDYEISKNSGNIFVFNDIINDSSSTGVVKFWNELKQSNEFDFYEFIEQYEEVWNHTRQRFLGIGVAIKKN